MQRRERLVAARKRALLTQAELARESGVSLRVIRLAERGNPISIRTKRKLMDALGIKHSQHERYFGRIEVGSQAR